MTSRPSQDRIRFGLLSVLLFLLLISLQAFIFTGISCRYSPADGAATESHYEIGLGDPVNIHVIRGTFTVDMHWLSLAANLAICYALAAGWAWLFVRMTRFRHPVLAFIYTSLVVCAVAFFTATGWSKYYWGYFIARPPVLREINRLATVPVVIPVQTLKDENGHCRLALDEDDTLSERVKYGHDDPYYCLDERLLLALEQHQLLPPDFSSDFPDMPDFHARIAQTGILAQPDEGYSDSDLLHGVVIDGTDSAGRRLVFAGMAGRQLSNDHYPYYEMLFSSSDGTNGLRYVRGQRFFYDVAGIEGAEWYVFWPTLSLLGIVIGLVAIALWRLIRYFLEWFRNSPAPPAGTAPKT